MELIKPGSKFDFVGISTPAMGVSLLLILLSLVSLFVKGGPKYGIDFTGGSVVQVRLTPPQEMEEIRAALQPMGMHEAEIQDFTDAVGDAPHRDFLIRLPLGGPASTWTAPPA